MAGRRVRASEMHTRASRHLAVSARPQDAAGIPSTRKAFFKHSSDVSRYVYYWCRKMHKQREPRFSQPPPSWSPPRRRR
eukprot:1018710-Rhodomonas_salina.2